MFIGLFLPLTVTRGNSDNTICMLKTQTAWCFKPARIESAEVVDNTSSRRFPVSLHCNQRGEKRKVRIVGIDMKLDAEHRRRVVWISPIACIFFVVAYEESDEVTPTTPKLASSRR